MELITENMHIEFQSSEPEIEIVSTKTKLKKYKVPMSDPTSFNEQFQFKDNVKSIFSYTIQLRVSSELDLKKKAIYHRHTIPLYHIKSIKPCECGSMVNIVD
jgi:hypothetical protein